MEMFYTSVKPIVFHGNNTKHRNSDFELSISLESINDHLKGNDPTCVVIYGEPGCGRTTFLSMVCDGLLQNSLKHSEICGLKVRAGCSAQSLWNFFSGISKDRHDKDTASLLLQSSAKLSRKYQAAQAFISSNFKLVCIDDAYADCGMVWSHLSQLLPEIKVHVIAVCTRKELVPLLHTTQLTELNVLSVELKGICVDSFKQSLSQKLPDWDLSGEELLRICTILNGNPTSLKILANAVNEFKFSPQMFDSEYLDEEEASRCSVRMVLQFLFPHLTAWEKQVLGQLCHLREVLPLRTVSEEIEKLVRLGLVDKEVISEVTGTSDQVTHSVSVPCCIQLSSLQLTHNCDNNGLNSEVQLHYFSVFDLWYGLLSEKLCQLVNDAQENAWPFVPEKW